MLAASALSVMSLTSLSLIDYHPVHILREPDRILFAACKRILPYFDTIVSLAGDKHECFGWIRVFQKRNRINVRSRSVELVRVRGLDRHQFEGSDSLLQEQRLLYD